MPNSSLTGSLPAGYDLLWYQIQNVLGRGGFGITYLAYDNHLDHKVAIKEYVPVDWANRKEDSSVKPISNQHEETFDWGLKNFIAEAQTLAKFKHPSIVRVLSVFKELNTAYMVMEYEQGEELSQQIKRGDTFTEKRLLEIVVPLLDGLEVVHEAGFIHRDIKPSNIMIRADGSPVLIDFGSARQAMGVNTRTLTSMITFGYAPFEQYDQGSEKQGPWTDIYALAATLYYATTGQLPIESIKRASAIVNAEADGLVPASKLAAGRYSESFLKSIDAALAFRVQDRPQSVSEWREMLSGRRTAEEICSAYPALALATASDTTVLIADDRTKIMAKLAPQDEASLNLKTKVASTPWKTGEVSGEGTGSQGKKLARRLAYAAMVSVLSVIVFLWYVSGARDPRLLVQEFFNGSTVPVAPNELSRPLEQGSAVAGSSAEVNPETNTPINSSPVAEPHSKTAVVPETESKAETNQDTQQEKLAGIGSDIPDSVTSDEGFRNAEPVPLSKESLLSGNAELRITSDPAGAVITLDGITIGETPFASESLLAGDYRLVVDAKNYRDHGQDIKLEADSPVNELIKLAPEKVDVTIRSVPQGAWVEINGERMDDTTPITLTGIEPRNYNIVLGKPEFKSSTIEVNTSKGGSYDQTIRLTPIDYGYLTIKPNPPTAFVNLPDMKTPYSAGMRLPVGNYRVEVFASNYEGWNETLTLTTNGLEKQVSLDFIHQPGDSFRDDLKVGGRGPELTILPTGSYLMGSNTGTKSETPQRRVNITDTIAMMKYEVTVGDFQKFVEATDYQTDAEKAGEETGCRVNSAGSWLVRNDVTWNTQEFFKSDNHAVSCVSWNDARAYAAWLSEETGVVYRLPSEAEWEYAARAGAAGNYAWGSDGPSCTSGAANGANFDGQGCTGGPDVAGNYSPNNFGLFDIHGNVWEWVADCWHPNYVNAPRNGIVWEGGDCRSRVLRGGSWTNSASYLRVSTRGVASHDERDISYGFRLVREVDL